MGKKLDRFITQKIAELRNEDITVLLAPFAINDSEASGLYLDNDFLYVDTRSKYWRLVFLHEYCHHLQVQNQTPMCRKLDLAYAFAADEETMNHTVALYEQEC